AENVLTMTVDLPNSVYRTATQMQAFHERTLAKLSRVPGVVAAGAVNWVPLGGSLMMGRFQVEGGNRLPPSGAPPATRAAGWGDKLSVSPGYFRAMGIRLLSGRDFTEQDNAAAPGVAIISQSVARRLWPDEDPIGKRIAMPDHPTAADWLTIVGVVDDVTQQNLTKKPDPAVYQPSLQIKHPFFLGHLTFAVRAASNPQVVAPAMRAVLREVDKDQPVQSIATVEELVARTTAEPLFQARLL